MPFRVPSVRRSHQGDAVTSIQQRGPILRFTPDNSRQVIQSCLEAVRAHLGTDVSFVGRFEAGQRIFEFVDADESFCPITPGESQELEDSYCIRVADGRLPELIIDTADIPEARTLTATTTLPVGAHISVPLRTPTGEAFGSFCSFSRQPDPNLRERDLVVMRVMADVVAAHMLYLLGDQDTQDQTEESVRAVLDGGGPDIALQPIFDLRRERISGYEALSRFSSGPSWTPDVWFSMAETVGLGHDLEAAAVRRALEVARDLPADLTLSINVSPNALTTCNEIREMLVDDRSGRIVLELTEHHPVVLTPAWSALLDRLRVSGVKVAVDDAGSGYAGLEHILDLRPDVLKLDRVLIQGIAQHMGRQAMCDAMVRFTGRTGAMLIAEGVEEDEDLKVLRYLGVRHAQGFLLGVPELWT